MVRVHGRDHTVTAVDTSEAYWHQWGLSVPATPLHGEAPWPAPHWSVTATLHGQAPWLAPHWSVTAPILWPGGMTDTTVVGNWSSTWPGYLIGTTHWSVTAPLHRPVAWPTPHWSVGKCSSTWPGVVNTKKGQGCKVFSWHHNAMQWHCPC